MHRIPEIRGRDEYGLSLIHIFVEAMLPYFSEYYGNPSSIYAIAGKSKEAITKGREQIANVLGAKPEEIYFTAGGSESDNWRCV